LPTLIAFALEIKTQTAKIKENILINFSLHPTNPTFAMLTRNKKEEESGKSHAQGVLIP
jgi:hypothetical protein